MMYGFVTGHSFPVCFIPYRKYQTCVNFNLWLGIIFVDLYFMDFIRLVKHYWLKGHNIKHFIWLMICAGLGFVFIYMHYSSQIPHTVGPVTKRTNLRQTDLDTITQLVSQSFPSSKHAKNYFISQRSLSQYNGPVYVVLRAKGRKLATIWETGSDWARNIVNGIERAKKKIKASSIKKIDIIELCLTYNYRHIKLQHDRQMISNVHRGVRGIVLHSDSQIIRYSPTEMIARNLSFDKIIESLDDKQDIVVEIFDAHQVLISLNPSIKVSTMFRGNTLIPQEAVTQDNVHKLAKGLQNWLVSQVHPDGRITYKYWPSRGEESTSNNMIRQFMATICLARIANFYNDDHTVSLLDKNIKYNLKHFYRKEGSIGYIEYKETVKLGAVAIATLAIIENPNRKYYTSYENAMRQFIRSMWCEDGHFKTFYKPTGRNDNHNFYPGEALLLWAYLIHENPNLDLLKNFMTSASYYREWHLNNRNPAFIPWHTQAYYMVWQQTKDAFLANWIFEMNDWLLDIQQWDNTVYDDTKGRFYHTSNRYGPPHASSTGVYLEGLVDAYKLARELDDSTRMKKYRRSIVRGLQSVMQLQFVDDIDMFYISKRDRVYGALRTTVYNNEIRIDNVQHVLMAVLKILSTFDPEDYIAS
ncbi:MAG: hypothetical protein ACYTBZ_07450 [Planctomycetota bacterium]|jgi:hypothetical protein